MCSAAGPLRRPVTTVVPHAAIGIDRLRSASRFARYSAPKESCPLTMAA